MRKFFLVLMVLFPLLGFGASIRWDANEVSETDTNVNSITIGYRVYSGQVSRWYSAVSDVGLSTTWTIPTSLLDGSTNFFTVTAYDADGLESDYSDEVSYVWTNGAPPVYIPPPENGFPSQVVGVKVTKISVIQLPPPVDVTNGLFARWKFDESIGIVAADSTTNEYSGTLVNGANFQIGKIGAHSVSLDGANDYVTFGQLAQVSNLTNFSISLWFKYAAPQPALNILISKWDNNLGGNFVIVNYPSSRMLGLVVITSAGSSQALYPFDYQNLNWHHLVAVYNGINIRLYLDGGTGIAAPQSGKLSTSDLHEVRVGASHSGDYFKGNIDDVRIYNWALTGNDVISIYRSL